MNIGHGLAALILIAVFFMLLWMRIDAPHYIPTCKENIGAKLNKQPRHGNETQRCAMPRKRTSDCHDNKETMKSVIINSVALFNKDAIHIGCARQIWSIQCYFFL